MPWDQYKYEVNIEAGVLLMLLETNCLNLGATFLVVFILSWPEADFIFSSLLGFLSCWHVVSISYIVDPSCFFFIARLTAGQ